MYHCRGSKPSVPPSIEVISSEENSCQEPESAEESTRSEKQEEWSSVAEHVDEPISLLSKPLYGFNRQYSGVFVSLYETVLEVIHLPEPDRTPEKDRKEVIL